MWQSTYKEWRGRHNSTLQKKRAKHLKAHWAVIGQVKRGQHLLSNFMVQSVIGLSRQKVNLMYTRKSMLEPGTTTLFVYRFFECKSNCFSKKNWQERSSHTNEDAMAARTCSCKTLTSCGSGIRIKSCRHVDESLWKRKLRNSVQRVDKN